MANVFDEVMRFHTAISSGNPDDVEEMLRVNPGLANTRLFNDTPLTLAARKGHLRICEFLVNAGADVNEPGEDGFSPVGNASVYYGQSGSKDLRAVIDLLLSSGCMIDRQEYMHMIAKGNEKRAAKRVPLE